MRMEPDRWRQVEEVFEAAVERPPEARAAFLDEACAEDPSLRQEVESLLSRDGKTLSFIEVSPIGAKAGAFDTKVPDSLVGRRVGYYKVISELGRGGMGVVYLAHDTRLGRRVALKLLPERYTDDEDRVRRFKLEARAASALNHPNILTVYEIGQVGQAYFIATEFVEGSTLRQYMSRGGVSLNEALDLCTQVASALQAAHRARIVHRDVKPENVMVRPDGLVKVLDFGLAKLAGPSEADPGMSTIARSIPGLIVGTPSYMSPEQAIGAPVDARSDMFTFGALLYECVTSQPAFSGANLVEIRDQILHIMPRPPSQANPAVTHALDCVTLKLLAKRAEERYQSAEEVLQDLRAASAELKDEGAATTPTRLKHVGVGALPRKAQAKTSEMLRRPRSLLAAAGLIVTITTLIYWWPWGQPGPMPAKAQYWYEKGTEALRNGAYHQARICLERAVEVKGDLPLIHARLAEAYLELDNKERARESLYRVSRLVPDRSALTRRDRLYVEAIMALANPTPDYAGAIEIYSELIRLSPDQPHSYVDLGRAYEKDNQTDNAIFNYERATKIDPEYTTAFLRLGILYGRQQQRTLSDQAFKRAEETYQANGSTEGRAEVHYQRGLALLAAKEVPGARAELRQAYDLARAAGSEAQQVLSLLQLGSVSIAEGDTQQAQRLAGEAVELARKRGMQFITMRGLVDIGRAFFHRGAPDDLINAEKYFGQALDYALMYKDRRNEARARFQLASFRLKLGRTDEGLADAENALEFYVQGGYKNEAWDALRLIGRAKRDKGDLDEALRTFVEQLELAKQMDMPLRVADAHEEIGRVLEFKEDYPQALSHFDESYKVISETTDREGLGYLLMSRGRMLWQLGQYPDAVAAFNGAAAAAGEEYVEILSALDQYASEMELSRRRLRDVRAKMQPILDQVNSQKIASAEAVTEARRVLGLAETFSGNTVKGERLCREAVDKAKEAGDPLLLSKALLALSESMLEGGQWQGALDVALQAQEMCNRVGLQESEWRTWLIAARASRGLNETGKAKEYAQNAGKSLSGLMQAWGAKAYEGYFTRPDTQTYHRQLTEFGVGV